jgi:Putative beta-lactamase-inhibitor-like, PepSY-like
MKKILFLLTAVSGLFLASCTTQDAVDPSNDILASMQASSARSAADADPVTKEKCKGKLAPIDPSALPATVTAYINANYANSAIKFAGKDDKGQIVVGLTVGTVETGLLFDANGAFVKILDNYGKRAKLNEIDIATLPASVSAYVTANYAGYTIKKAGKDADGNILVGIKNDAGHKVLKFDAAGKFVEELQVPPHDKGPKKH